MRNFSDICDISYDDITSIINLAFHRKSLHKDASCGYIDDKRPCYGKTMVAFFESSSTRTRLALESAMHRLGGHFIFLNNVKDSPYHDKELLEDSIRVINNYADIMSVRTYCHDRLHEVMKFFHRPVINCLSNLTHPCQVLSEIMTYLESFPTCYGKSFCWMGDGRSNVLRSYIEASCILGFNLHIVTDRHYIPLVNIDKMSHVYIHHTINAEYLYECTAIITDTWQSMHEQYDEDKLKRLSFTKITQDVFEKCRKDALLFHCMPMYRDQEIDASLCFHSRSRIMDVVLNKTYLMESIILWALDLA